MAVTSTDVTERPDYLIALFKQDMERKLVAEAIEAIRPAIRKAAAEAVKSLEAAIHARRDVMADQVVMNLVIKDSNGIP